MLLVGVNNEKFGEMKDNLSNIYLIRDNQYYNKREGLVGLLNN